MRRPFTFSKTVLLLLLAAVAGVHTTPLRAQSQDAARVVEMQGQVSVLRGNKVALFQNSTVKIKEEIVTGPDGHAIFQISDGSTFEIFPNSRVAFRDSVTWVELLNVLIGKIRVQIEHKDGPNPKKVKTPTAIISVRGTIFDVSVDGGDGTTVVSVEEGQVVVQHLLQPSATKTLGPNESVTVIPNQPLAKVAGTSTPVKYIFDRVAQIVKDVAINSGVGMPGGNGGPRQTPGGGPQGDKGKDPKTPPPAPPPPPPGGGN